MKTGRSLTYCDWAVFSLWRYIRRMSCCGGCVATGERRRRDGCRFYSGYDTQHASKKLVCFCTVGDGDDDSEW